MSARKQKLLFTVAYAIVTALAIAAMRALFLGIPAPRPVSYDTFLRLVREGRVDMVEIRDTDVLARLGGGADRARSLVTTERIPGTDDRVLVEELDRHGVTFSGHHERVPFWKELLVSMAPFLFFTALYYFGVRRVGRAAGPLSLGRHRAKIHDANEANRITFGDVAGVDEAKTELVEIVEFLRTPDRYRALGARIPRGVLLVGPPGTGKTLLARAVAGEARVPFFSISGSEFVEMFVGMGAARVRDLFDQAKQRAPCIVFIDELDAIGKSRGGVAALATHDEREQTLNQLLVEIDGFDGSQGVVIMGATNRPEVLDPALLRAGRFDRQVVVDRPDVTGREAILRLHCRSVKLGATVDLAVVARRTSGMVGADLANVVNEAALAAVRRRSGSVEAQDFDEALDRLQLGLKKHGRGMTDDEKRRVAHHEAGHALVALSLEKADPVHRVTIIPRSIGALGATLQLPVGDRHLVTRRELEDRIAVMLGGRAAEEVACGDVSSGALNDLERATDTARQMVCHYGMSERLGPLTYGRPRGARFLDDLVSGGRADLSEETARAIDAEVRAVVTDQHERARRVLNERRAALCALAARLIEAETLDRPEIDRIVAEAEGTASSQDAA